MDVLSFGDTVISIIASIAGIVSSTFGGLGQARSLKRMDVGDTLLLDSQTLSQAKGCEESARKMKEVGDFLIEQAHHDLIPPTYSKRFIMAEIVITGLFIGLLLSYCGHSVNNIEFVTHIICSVILLVALFIELIRWDKLIIPNRQPVTRESASPERVRGIPARVSVVYALASIVGSLVVCSVIFNLVDLCSWDVRLAFIIIAFFLFVVFLYCKHRDEMSSS